MVSNQEILDILSAQFGADIYGADQPYDLLTLDINPAKNLDFLNFLKDHPHLQCVFLTDITAVHYPELAGKELCVVYHMHSFVHNARIRLKAYIPIENPDIASATPLFNCANWMERETYDFFGVNFTGHPNLIRILNVDEMDYFPMRKGYPLEDQTRTDKDDEMFGR